MRIMRPEHAGRQHRPDHMLPVPVHRPPWGRRAGHRREHGRRTRDKHSALRAGNAGAADARALQRRRRVRHGLYSLHAASTRRQLLAHHPPGRDLFVPGPATRARASAALSRRLSPRVPSSPSQTPCAALLASAEATVMLMLSGLAGRSRA